MFHDRDRSCRNECDFAHCELIEFMQRQLDIKETEIVRLKSFYRNILKSALDIACDERSLKKDRYDSTTRVFDEQDRFATTAMTTSSTTTLDDLQKIISDDLLETTEKKIAFDQLLETIDAETNSFDDLLLEKMISLDNFSSQNHSDERFTYM